MTEYYKGLIILSNDLDEEIAYQSLNIKNEYLRIWQKDEFKIEDSHEVISEAYIASENVKTIIIAAKSFNHFAQNALLKILEEPPKNIRFILIAKNKTSFLMTIRSRLSLEDKRKKTKPKILEININNMTLKNIYDFLKSLETQGENSINDTKEKIEALLLMSKQNNIFLDEEELKSFDEALIANQNYQKDIYTLLPLLLMIMQKNKLSKNIKG
ncbi:DNA polymerase III subunit delta' [Helicobacter sp. 13S00477-4]|uniref:DNA polymerase III subunit delta' n=1 Tax=Helicobacter sp. 13S00477-4 TaxID=1905759 RepID=UPI000BA785B3|nr:DNA polymerase III subunit delta' [Helicobacter sp. 13S00477-4]PAF52639.1 hypothetical protein BKH44_00155 [Helicobacter sp. 13S00477-4]